MSDYIEVSLIIIGESVGDDMYSKIIEEIRNLDDKIVTISHAAGTNTISVSARWDQSEVDTKTEQIKKIPNVKYVMLAHQHRVVQRSISDSVKISDAVSWVKETEPIGLITRAKDNRDYYGAISLSCSFFQSFGEKILLWDSQKTGNKITNDQLKDLYSITNTLSSRGLIDQDIFKKMDDARNLRNEFQHGELAFKLSSGQAQDAEVKVKNALDCVKFLKTTYDKVIL